MTQTVGMESLGDSSREKIKRLQHSEMTGEIDYSVEIEHYRGRKKNKNACCKNKEKCTNFEISGEHGDLFKQGTRNRLCVLAECDNIR